MGRSFGHGPLDFNAMSPAIKALVIANAAIFLLGTVVGGQFMDLFGLVPIHVVHDRWLWQPVTYLFLHGTFLHLLFNLFSLWMFGMPVESQWGSAEFTKYYLICGVGAGLVSAFIAPDSPFPIIGASGAEISTGPIIRGGELGGFLEQRVVTAGKLGLSRRVADQDRVEEIGRASCRERV